MDEKYFDIEFELEDLVTCESGYHHKEIFKVVGIRREELELEGDWSGGTNPSTSKSWIPIKECRLYEKSEPVDPIQINDYDYYEAMDRTYIINTMIDTLLLSQPIYYREEIFRKLINDAGDSLTKAYMYLGGVSMGRHKMDQE